MRSARLWAILTLMALTFVVMKVRGDVDRVPPSTPLDQLPATLDGYTSTDIPLDPGVLDVLGKGVFLNRMYVPSGMTDGAPATNAAAIGLFIGYFPTQRSNQSIHSPQHCLPGAGWTFDRSGVTVLTDQQGKEYRVGEYLISNGKTKQEVLYWYRLHGRSIASDYVAKLDTLADSLRYGRTDAALVRVITPVEPGESLESAHDRATGFAAKVAPLLPAYIPD